MSPRYGIVLLPRFSLLSLAGITEVLRVAAELQGQRLAQTLLYSRDGRAVAAAGGESLNVGAVLTCAPTPPLDALFVIASTLPSAADWPWIEQHLRAAAVGIDARGGVLAGIDCGAAWLARGGMLRGHRCTVSARHSAETAAANPGVIVSSHCFEIDRNRLSCGAGQAVLDLMIQWLAQSHGPHLSTQLTGHFGLDRLRSGQDRQMLPMAARIGASTKLAEAVALMESNLEEPLSTEDIARLVGVSRRQLERLFKQHLDTLPSRWYLEQRLERARQMLQQGSQSILQIGLRCGFSSGAHFSNAYRQCFGRTPRDERSTRAAAWREHSDTRPIAFNDNSAAHKDRT